jgi:hypothetical protein
MLPPEPKDVRPVDARQETAQRGFVERIVETSARCQAQEFDLAGQIGWRSLLALHAESLYRSLARVTATEP